MTDRPILFSAPMVKELLTGNKSQTRRALKPQPNMLNGGKPLNDGQGRYSTESGWKPYPIAKGDRLWVRERIAYRHDIPADKARDERWYKPVYEADGEPTGFGISELSPAIFMPKWASRITLLVDDVKVERLQDISEDDAIAEGVETERCCGVPSDSCGVHLGGCCGQPEAIEPIEAYAALWDHINGEGAWADNPWVCAYTFRVVLENIDYIGRAA